MKKLFLIPVLLLFILSCSNAGVKDTVITKENKDEIIEKIKKGKDLTGEEVGLFIGAMARASISGQPVEGKTVREVINDQRKVAEEVKAKEAETNRLADEAKRKEEQIAKELSEYVIVVPIKKEFRKANPSLGEYENRIIIEMAFENKGDKDIRAFRGKTVFKDLFGDHIYSINWYYDEGLKSKEKKHWIGSVKYNQFLEADQKFASTELENMKVEWVPKGIIFKDGSKLGID